VVVAGGEHLAGDIAPEVGDLFGALVDEQRDDVDVGVVLLGGKGDVLEQRRLTGLGGETIMPRCP